MKLFPTLLLAIALVNSQLSAAAEKNSPAPEFNLPTQNSETVSLTSLKGKTVLVNFWASWCKPCRKEIPELVNIFKKYKDQGFEIVGINIDKEKQNATRFMKEFNINYTVAFDPQMNVINRYEAVGMPSSFIVDKNGMIREIVYGFSDKKKKIIETNISGLLAE